MVQLLECLCVFRVPRVPNLKLFIRRWSVGGDDDGDDDDDDDDDDDEDDAL